jgi:hypothetical protein
MNKENMAYIPNGVVLSHKKHEIMSFAGKRMELEIIILSEISQTQKDKYHMFFFSSVQSRLKKS